MRLRSDWFRSLSLILMLALLLALALPGVPALAQEDAPPPDAATTEEPAESDAEDGLNILERFDTWFGANIVSHMDDVLFFEVGFPDVTDEDGNILKRKMPMIVVVLFLGGLFFTFRYGFINVRLFRHSIDVIRGKYDRPEDEGEISHFKALTSALSATVGLGNIGGVAIAISVGGAGAVFWMWLTAFFGMSMKFSSCTFAHLHRRVHADGRVLGGPMVYLEEGYAERSGWFGPRFGKTIAVLFAILTVFAAFGGGNMYQSNQTASIIAMQFFDGDDSPALRIGLGIFLATLVGMVLIGGIKRIGEITSRLVPGMCVFYCAICLAILLMNTGKIPGVFVSIFSNAFQAEALFGGFIGVLIQGMKRAAFSNEAGLGSAAIAHAAAKTDEPVREGVVAMIGPFIDTIVVCTMTALAILITGAHLGDAEGVEITAIAFAQLGWFVPYALCLAVFVFAYSTIIAWGYYGERAIEYLFGERGILPYRVVYVSVVVLGPMLSLKNVIGFSDIVLLSMAFPNIIGMAIISGKVKEMTKDYVRRLKSGEMKPVQ